MLLRKQAVNAGHAYVGDEFDSVAHEADGDHGFFGNGQIAGAGADYSDGSLAGNGGRLSEGDGASGFVELGAGFDCEDRIEHFTSSASGEDVASGLGHAGEDGCYLGGGFAGGKDDLGHTGAEGAVMIDLGETEIFERKIAEAVEGFVDRRAALADFVEQRFDAGAIHFLGASSWLHFKESLRAQSDTSRAMPCMQVVRPLWGTPVNSIPSPMLGFGSLMNTL